MYILVSDHRSIFEKYGIKYYTYNEQWWKYIAELNLAQYALLLLVCDVITPVGEYTRNGLVFTPPNKLWYRNIALYKHSERYWKNNVHPNI